MKKSRIYWIVGLIVLLLGCQQRVANEPVAEANTPIEMLVDKAETIVVDTSMTEGQIFLNEDEMLLALQGSWLWEDQLGFKEGFFRNSWLNNGKKQYFKQYDFGFTVSYLLTPTSFVELGGNFATNLLDIDILRMIIDMPNNSITIRSYYLDDYSITFHFLDKDRLWIEDSGTFLHIGRYYIDSNGLSVSKLGAPNFDEESGEILQEYQEYLDGLRMETVEETKERIRNNPQVLWSRTAFIIGYYQGKIIELTGQQYIFVKVDGFEHDAEYNVYDQEGNFLMNPRMIRENRYYELPMYSALE